MDGAGAKLAACPRCRQPSPWNRRAADYNRRLTKERFDYYLYQPCGIVSATLSEHAIGLGLKPLLVTTTDVGSLDWNDFGWRMTLANGTQSPLLRRVMHRIGRTVGKALSFIEGGEGRGSAYTAIYRKPGPA